MQFSCVFEKKNIAVWSLVVKKQAMHKIMMARMSKVHTDLS
jgi:hypothetical protein